MKPLRVVKVLLRLHTLLVFQSAVLWAAMVTDADDNVLWYPSVYSIVFPASAKSPQRACHALGTAFCMPLSILPVHVFSAMASARL